MCFRGGEVERGGDGGSGGLSGGAFNDALEPKCSHKMGGIG